MIWLLVVAIYLLIILIFVLVAKILFSPSEMKREIEIPVKKEICEHLEWDIDNQIRTIKCRSCGKKAWVKEYKNLYKEWDV